MTRSKNTNVCAIIVSALLALSLTTIVSAQTVPVRVNGDVTTQDPNADGSSWQSDDVFKYLQDALNYADILLDDPEGPDTVEIWVAATDPGNPYVPHNN